VTPDSVKEALLLFRPSGPDSEEPGIKEALDQTVMDVELRTWFEEHCNRQSIVRDQFRQIPVPDELEKRILAELARRRTIVWWQRREVWTRMAAAAALVAMMLTLYFVSRPDQAKGFADYRSRMVRSVQRFYGMDMDSNDRAAIRNYLGTHRGHPDFVLPPGLEGVRAEGCSVLPWQGKKISMVCFQLNHRPDLYLFVVSQKDFSDPPPSDQPQFVTIGKFASASWSTGDKAYILTARGDETLLRRYVQ
jgi:hypothetical protein